MALVATACGGGRSTFAPTTVANAATDRAAAGAINLTATDLPGWQSSPNPKTSGDVAFDARMAACAGAANPATVDIVDVSSPNFDLNNSEVSSDVTTVHTAAQAESDLRAMRSSKLAPCLQRVGEPYLQSTLPSGARIAGLTVDRLTLANPPANSFAYRLVVSVSVSGQGTVVVDHDTIGFLVGRAELELDVTQTNGTPDPSLEQRLVALLVGRARSPSIG